MPNVKAVLMCGGMLLALSGGWCPAANGAASGTETGASSESPATVEQLPNIVIVFADDLGYADIGCFGATGYQTPHLDQLAAEGRKFTHFYAAQAVCSASRAALMTGCYPNRVGVRGAFGPRAGVGLHLDEVTIAEVVKSKGYATAAVGKWHLGDDPTFLPTQQGFDQYYGLPYSNDMWPLHPSLVDLSPEERKKRRGYPPLPLISGTAVIDADVSADDQRQLTTNYTREAVTFIEQNHDRPFFLYLAHSMPHVPLYVSDKFAGQSQRGVFGDVVAEVDWSVGQVIATLHKFDLARRTLVIFTSDNGPWLTYGDHAGSAGVLREGKGTAWEGGVREPCVMWWPGRIPAGTECGELAATIDLLPTIARLTGAELPNRPLDGRDLSALLFEPAAKTPHEVYWYYWGGALHAVRSGPWKLHFPHDYTSVEGQSRGTGGKPGGNVARRSIGLALYNLDTDPGERNDVHAQHPDVVERLTQLGQIARRELGDEITEQTGTGVRPLGRVKE